jgi:hypothetical protein
MADYQKITELVSQIPVDTWKLLQEIKQRRPAMMLSELIDYSKRVSLAPQRPERGSPYQRAYLSRVGNIAKRLMVVGEPVARMRS